MAESSPPSTSWVGTWFEGNPPTQFFVDVNNDNGYFRAHLFLIGKKKKRKGKTIYFRSNVSSFSDARSDVRYAIFGRSGNLNHEIFMKGIKIVEF